MNRLIAIGKTLRYVNYLDDYPVTPLANIWEDTQTSGFTGNRYYVVQTHPTVIQRCLLMTTDPGDLVLDPTCGSGTIAYVAEQWGRRWITVDTSRVPLALARQRLLTATFPYYALQDEARGPRGGASTSSVRTRRERRLAGSLHTSRSSRSPTASRPRRRYSSIGRRSAARSRASPAPSPSRRRSRPPPMSRPLRAPRRRLRRRAAASSTGWSRRCAAAPSSTYPATSR